MTEAAARWREARLQRGACAGDHAVSLPPRHRKAPRSRGRSRLSRLFSGIYTHCTCTHCTVPHLGSWLAVVPRHHHLKQHRRQRRREAVAARRRRRRRGRRGGRFALLLLPRRLLHRLILLLLLLGRCRGPAPLLQEVGQVAVELGQSPGDGGAGGAAVNAQPACAHMRLAAGGGAGREGGVVSARSSPGSCCWSGAAHEMAGGTRAAAVRPERAPTPGSGRGRAGIRT